MRLQEFFHPILRLLSHDLIASQQARGGCLARCPSGTFSRFENDLVPEFVEVRVCKQCVQTVEKLFKNIEESELKTSKDGKISTPSCFVTSFENRGCKLTSNTCYPEIASVARWIEEKRKTVETSFLRTKSLTT